MSALWLPDTSRRIWLPGATAPKPQRCIRDLGEPFIRHEFPQPLGKPTKPPKGGGKRNTGSSAPPSTANLIVDLRSDKGTYQDAGLTTIATPGTDPLGGWKDQSSAAHNFTEATNKPTLKANQVNGYPGVEFDGVNDLLKGLFTFTSGHIFMVAKQITWTLNNCLLAGATGDNFSVLQDIGTPKIAVWNGTGGSGSNSGMALGSWCILELSPTYFRVNRGTSTVFSPFGGADKGGLTIAAHPGPNSWGNISVAALWVYSAAQSGTTLDNILNTLATTYGITLL